MIVKNTSKNIIFHIFVNEISREIIIDFSRKETKVENLQILRERGKTSIKGGKSDVFEGKECDHCLYDYIISRCKECGLENVINRHDCKLTIILL